jgi:O-antigen/teichoic acid export membrane protein
MTGISKSYKRNYFLIYFWQGLSILLGFFAMLVVMPYLSSDRAIFGVYSVCMSVSIFLAYADLGFLGAGQKYAAEEFAKGDLERERTILGFTGFVLAIFVAICGTFFAVLSLYPDLLIKGVAGEEKKVAHALFLILALSSPITVLQRVTQLIFNVRIEDFIFQRFMITGSIVKIVSVFLFFRPGHYEIVQYYAFVQVVNLLMSLSALYIAELRYSYGILKLFRAFRFSHDIFGKTKDLAFSSLFLTISWILYYECDNFVISRLLGAEAVAVYAIGLTLMTFLRSLLGSLFSPFISRFNHYIGLGDEAGLKQTLTQVISLTTGPVVLFITTILMLMRPLIYAWVGQEYSDAVVVAQLLLSCNLLASFYYPGGILLVAKERIRLLYGLGAVLPIVYWLGVILTYPVLGLKAFGLFKFVAFFSTSMVYIAFIVKYLDVSIWNLFKRSILPLALTLAILVVSLAVLRGALPLEKGKTGLLLVIGLGGVVALPNITAALYLDPEGRRLLKSLVRARKIENS